MSGIKVLQVQDSRFGDILKIMDDEVLCLRIPARFHSALLTALLKNAGMRAVAVYQKTNDARFCNKAGPMGGGCEDSWHVGGNYGSHVCYNPDHHDTVHPPTNEEERKEYLEKETERIKEAQQSARKRFGK